MRILGISAFFHDSAAAIIKDGAVEAAAQEERFSRKKNDPSFPKASIKYCLEHTGLSIGTLDAIAFYDKPLLKLERILETYYAFAPRGIKSFLQAMPIWLQDKMFLKNLIYRELKQITPDHIKKIPLLFPEHHLSHAASAFYPSPFSEAAILTIDGVGEWATASLAWGEKEKIQVLKELRFPHSLGLLYSAFTYFLGFRVNSGEYKLMGLAPYGNIKSSQVQAYINLIKTKLIDIKKDGSLWLNPSYFQYTTGLRMISDKKWEKLFGFSRRKPESAINQYHCDLARAIQDITEEVVIKMAQEAKRLTQSESLCMAGGVALNSVANGQLQRSRLFKNIFIQPAAGDAGGALGAALATHHIYFQQERKIIPKKDLMQGSFLGPDFSEKEILSLAKKKQAIYQTFEDFSKLCQKTAQLLSQGYVIGWMQGRMEFGPRALGARSILADPRLPEMQKKINLEIKHRESFRPFAPAVLKEDQHIYFESAEDSPYMLLVNPLQPSWRKDLPSDYESWPPEQKLDYIKSDLPAVTHVDFSARIQTVDRERNPPFWELLSAFKAETGCGVLLNTSFNVRGEPIVCNPEDAYRCFIKTALDFLVIGPFLFDKNAPGPPGGGLYKLLK